MQAWKIKQHHPRKQNRAARRIAGNISICSFVRDGDTFSGSQLHLSSSYYFVPLSVGLIPYFEILFEYKFLFSRDFHFYTISDNIPVVPIPLKGNEIKVFSHLCYFMQGIRSQKDIWNIYIVFFIGDDNVNDIIR